MPWGDRTGPWGRGPMTGRRAGFCTGYQRPGYANPYVPGYGRGRGYGCGFGRGFGRGHGFGRGRRFGWFGRRGYYPTPVDDPYDYPEYLGPGPATEMSKEDETKYLTKLAESLENELKEIKNRLKELSGKQEK